MKPIAMDNYPALEKRPLPKPPHWSKAIGVGIVVMGLGIGTGELILWPHLVTKHGLTLLWLALLGIGFQYFINKEVARHEVATGEGFFTTSARVVQWSVFFWLFAAIILYIWPAWASAIGTTLTELFGFGTHLIWSWATLVLVLVLTFSGRVAYTMLEKSLKITVPTFFILLVAISFFNLSLADVGAALKGIVSFGTIPEGVNTFVLLSAVVFAGAGGMLNLAVSLWYRDKQVGMGSYIGRVTNPITGRNEAVSATGYTFDMDNAENMKNWRAWMRYVNIDQGIIFFALGFTTLVLLATNAYAVLTPKGLVPEGLDIAVVQAHIFGDVLGPIGFKLFLVMAFLMLFSVMWTVIDALTRIVSDIIYTNARAGKYKKAFSKFERFSIGQLYYGTIIIVALLGAVLVLFEQPLTLLVISGVLSGLSMALYTPFLIYINNTRLAKPLRPSFFTNFVMVLISVFFAYFSYRVVLEAFYKLFG
ncbi:MAG: Nramp family divalent metal transporter [Patescibacteria group bacterium]